MQIFRKFFRLWGPISEVRFICPFGPLYAALYRVSSVVFAAVMVYIHKGKPALKSPCIRRYKARKYPCRCILPTLCIKRVSREHLMKPAPSFHGVMPVRLPAPCPICPGSLLEHGRCYFCQLLQFFGVQFVQHGFQPLPCGFCFLAAVVKVIYFLC